MNDKFFKNLLHNAEGYSVLNSGGQLVKGYKPDTVLQKGNEHIIMECDTSTSRKGYLGAMLKAVRFLSNERKGILVLVIKEKPNTKVKQIAEHLQEYLVWLQPLTNLNTVYLIESNRYCPDENPLELLSSEFITTATIINSDR